MPQIDGQLNGAQLEEISSASPTPACRSRIYSDITDTSNAIPKFYNGSAWKRLSTDQASFKSKSANYTVLSTDEYVTGDASSAGFTFSLPTAVGLDGKVLTFKKIDTSSNAVTLDASGSQTIDGALTLLMVVSNQVVSIISDGANWQVLDNYMIFSTVSKTSTYTAKYSDGTILCDSSSAAFTVNLPAAATMPNKEFLFKKTDSTFATVNAITIDANGSETIDGSLTTTLNTQNESLLIRSDGTNWRIVERKIPSVWTSYSMTIGGTTTAPTKGATPSIDSAVWRRMGDSIQVQYTLVNTNAGSAGSGTYLFPLPTGLVTDSSKFSTSSGLNPAGLVGSAAIMTGAGLVQPGYIKMHDSLGNLCVVAGSDVNAPALLGSAFCGVNTAGVTYSFIATVPVVGWSS